MAFCKNCGHSLTDGEKFCTSCGAKQSDEQTPPPNAFSTNGSGQPQPDNISGTYYDRADIENTKVICCLSYISILFFLPLVAYPNSRYGKFHANQALLLLIAGAILGTVVSISTGIIGAMPFIADFIKIPVNIILGAIGTGLPFAGMIYGMINAYNGNAKELPVIGSFNLINK